MSFREDVSRHAVARHVAKGCGFEQLGVLFENQTKPWCVAGAGGIFERWKGDYDEQENVSYGGHRHPVSG